MAINDNDNYTLTGAQVKDLAQRVKAGGGGGGVLIGYINYTSATVPSSSISVYTDTTYTTAISADDVAAALDNGDTVFFKFTDGWDEIKILSIADSEAMIGDDTIVYHFMASSSKDCIGQLQGHVNDWDVAYFLSTLKTVGNGTLTITQNGTSAGTFSANASGSSTIALTDTTYSAMTGATSGAAGTSGLVPAPAAGDQDKVLSGAGTWVAQTVTPLNIYPVGSIYMSVNNTNPGTLFGGTWAQIKDRFILAAGSTYAGGATGGSAAINIAHSHTVNSHNHSLPANTGSHKLTVSEIPAHTHGTGYQWNTGSGTARWGVSDNLATTAATSSTGGGGGHTHTIGGNTGDKSPGTDSKLSSSQSILPPYLAVYVWKRTA